MSKQQRKFEKAKKREREVRQRSLMERAATLRTKKLEAYPKFVVSKTDADEEFIEAVMKAVAKVDLLDERKLGAGYQGFLRSGKEHGFLHAFQNLNSLPEFRASGPLGPSLEGLARMTYVVCMIGEMVYQQIPVEIRRKYIPYNDVRIEPIGNELTLKFSRVSSVKGEFGRVYFSPREPVIDFDGKQYKVAFSDHAIERVCQRMNPEYHHYGVSGDIYAFFNNCIYFEPTKLLDGEPAFAVFDSCHTKGFAQYQTYCVNVFGEENVLPNAGELYYRVGYCPVVFENGFAKAKTFLPPGFKKTPEYELLCNRGSYSTAKRDLRLKSTAEDRCERDLLYWNDSELSMFFHENGVPQVFQWKHQVFDYR
jgi:hypothetical protein